nr:unnamed protein product [Digitaria exilis]
MAPVTATRAFLVPGYSNSDGYLVGDYLPSRSAAFAVGGYDWSIHYRPSAESVDLCLWIEIKEAPMVTASFSVSLLDPTGSLPPWKLPEATSRVFDPRHVDNSGEVAVSMARSFLQDLALDPEYLTRGGLLFDCTITVFTETTTPALSRAEAPESDVMEQLGKIYATEDGSDVTYSVKGKLFRAHKIILAMRSPVFKAQLYGGMMESTAEIIEVEDVLPDVFEALLRYIYTDALPAMDAIKVDDEHDEEVDEDIDMV